MIIPNALEILGYGLSVSARSDGPTTFWSTLAPEGTKLPRMLNVGFGSRPTFRWGTIFQAAGDADMPKLTVAHVGGESMHMLLNGARKTDEVAHLREAACSGIWWIRAHLSEALSIDLPWMPLYFIQSTPPGSATPCELHGPLRDLEAFRGGAAIGRALQGLDSAPRNGLIIIRGPVPPGALNPDSMLAGQQEKGYAFVDRGRTEGVEWIETTFTGDHGETTQRNYFRDVGDGFCLVTGQSPPADAAVMRDYAELIATKLARVPR